MMKKNKTFVICKDCGIEGWVKNELINRAPNRGIYCWECDVKREEKKSEKKRIKELKEEEKTYCKDKEHNYLGVYHVYWKRIVYVCSKCGKQL